MKLYQKVNASFLRYEEVVVAYLFGSRARGDFIEGSDMDFAILLSGNFKDPYDFVRLIGELATVLNVKDEKINLVVLNDADLELAYKVISEGSVVFERDVEKRVDFEVRVLKSYLNFKPVLDQKHHPATWMPHASNNLKTITIPPKLTKRTT